jgi:hypothetical protein
VFCRSHTLHDHTDTAILCDRQQPLHSPAGPAEFTVAGLRIRCSDSFIEHAWDFTPATSLWVECSTDDEQQRLFTALRANGRVHMPLDDYGLRPIRLGGRPLRRLLAVGAQLTTVEPASASGEEPSPTQRARRPGGAARSERRRCRR